MNRFIIYVLTLGVFLTATSELVVSGVLNVIAQDLRVSIALAGQLITVYSLAYAIGTPIVISMTYRMGRKKLLAGALTLFIAGCLVSAVSADFTMLMAARVILGLSAGVFLVVSFSSVAKIVAPEKIGSAIGTVILGFSASLILGIPFGIAIANWLNWQAIFIILAILSLIILFAVIRLLPEIEGDAPIPFKQQLLVLTNPIILAGLFITFFREAGNSIMYTYLTPFLANIMHLHSAEIGLTMLIFGIAGVVGSRFGGFAVDKWGTSRMIIISFTVPVASLALLPVVTASLLAGIGLLTVWICSTFVSAPALQTYFIQQAPQSSSLVLSLNTSVIHLGLAAGAGLGGAVINSTSTVLYNPWAASIAIALGLVAAAASFSFRKSKQTVPA
ncbi:MFS transporter [Paenibacillus alkalitolerans]|uniref:MFS transporter n=1 Tax=Paenibacillus alkalitolerans TaxID=2799335 RepID=UPI0018F702B3|nr:MFS transporter [Paenibacillus alkalitolerans]